MVLAVLYIVNGVLVILTLALNSGSAEQSLFEENTPITPIVFQLDGVAGNAYAVRTDAALKSEGSDVVNVGLVPLLPADRDQHWRQYSHSLPSVAQYAF
mgnify:CR=1 FL=1